MNAATLARALGLQTGYIGYTVKVNLEGLSDEDALVGPGSGGNCANWITGHLLHARVGLLALMSVEPPFASNKYLRYERNSGPVSEPEGTVPLAEMINDFADTGKPLQAGLESLTDEFLAREAPAFPGGDSRDNMGALMTGLVFHEAYHAGQLGVLRRVSGQEGAIK